MPVPDRIAEGRTIVLPPAAGDVNAVRFDPNPEWLSEAPPEQQQTAMWRWFATRYEDPRFVTPHDNKGEYFYTDGGPYLADRVLHEQFDGVVPEPVIDELVHDIQDEVGNEWALKTVDKFGG